MSLNNITEENLNAFIDDQLATSERMQVFKKLKEDQILSQTLCELQRNDELLSLTYSNPPEPAYDPYQAAVKINYRKYQALAASFLFMFSAIAGWQLHQYVSPFDATPKIQNISQLDTVQPGNKKVLIHVSKMDSQRIEHALDKAEALLNEKGGKDLQLEIVANADGLAMVRQNSPFASRIRSISEKHNNVSFKACGIAMAVTKLKEGKEVTLLPEAKKVPAALDQILERLKAGWLYIKA